MKKKQQLDSIKLGEIIELLTRLNNDIGNLKADIEKTTEKNDARRIGLAGLQQVVAPAAIWFHSLAALFDRINNKDDFPTMVSLPDLPLAEILYMMEGFARWGLQTLSHFKLESLLYNILVSLDPALIEVRGFGRIMDGLFENITIAENVEEKKKIFLAFAAIRNTFHSNGIHNNDSFKVVINDTEFDFHKGEPIKCASLRNTCILIDSCINILSEILHSPEVENYGKIMEDEYVKKVEIVTREEFGKL